MLEAVRLVREEGLTGRKVAQNKGISMSALSGCVTKYQHYQNANSAPNYTHSKIFINEQEQKLAEYLKTYSGE